MSTPGHTQRIATSGSYLVGSAMGMSIIVALVIALFSGFFVMSNHLGQITTLHYETKERLMNNSESGIQYLLADPDEIATGEFAVMDLFGDKLDSVFLERRMWGMMEVCISKAIFHEQSYTRVAMIGGGPEPAASRIGLYLCDLGRPLSVCGDTHLGGNTFLPEAGIKRAYIEGQNYTGAEFVYGNEGRSKKELPPLREEILKVIPAMFNGSFGPDDESMLNSEMPSDSIERDFGMPTLVLTANGTFNTAGLFLRNNIVVYSPVNVLVSKESALDGIMIIAPQVEIESGFRGNIQVFASANITVHEDVVLEYPSSLCMFPGIEPVSTDHVLTVEKNCSVAGTILAERPIGSNIMKLRVQVAEGFEMRGELYVDGDLDIKGNIYGSVWCERIFLRTNSAVYENHLLNTTIDPVKLSPHYLGSAFFEHKNRSVLKWL